MTNVNTLFLFAASSFAANRSEMLTSPDEWTAVHAIPSRIVKVEMQSKVNKKLDLGPDLCNALLGLAPSLQYKPSNRPQTKKIPRLFRHYFHRIFAWAYVWCCVRFYGNTGNNDCIIQAKCMAETASRGAFFPQKLTLVRISPFASQPISILFLRNELCTH